MSFIKHRQADPAQERGNRQGIPGGIQSQGSIHLPKACSHKARPSRKFGLPGRTEPSTGLQVESPQTSPGSAEGSQGLLTEFSTVRKPHDNWSPQL